jgi:hypothetical protein
LSSASYSELLLDPRWQRKRLEIMQRDDFTCQKCSCSSDTLNVHHCYYENGLSPWEYPDSSLLTLCKLCHSEEKPYAQRKQLLAKGFGINGFITEDLIQFCISFVGVEWPVRDYIFLSALCWLLESADRRHGLIAAYFEDLAKNRKHPGGGPTADSQETSATGRDSCKSGTAERRNEAGMEA